MGSIKGDLHVL